MRDSPIHGLNLCRIAYISVILKTLYFNVSSSSSASSSSSTSSSSSSSPPSFSSFSSFLFLFLFLFFFFFFYSLLALLGVELLQPDPEGFPVIRQPSRLLQSLTFLLVSCCISSSCYLLGLPLHRYAITLVSHTRLQHLSHNLIFNVLS